ncbi:MAG: lipopolysaccharide transport periplasmic protein LptA [Pseudomonadota bacterium]|jgi:lipopolysaccharide export system protein LptA
MRNRAEVPVLAMALLVAAVPAAALKSDREQPMEIDADGMVSNVDAGDAVLSGNVRIVQGTLRVRAERAEISRNDAGEVSRAVLTGAPATLAEDLDDGGRLDARAATIDYDMGGKLVVLTGDAVVAQPQGELRGERITYNLETGRLDAGGPEGGNRVFLRMNPQPKQPTAPAADKPAD